MVQNSDDIHFSYIKYGSFTDNLNRGRLRLPEDAVCQSAKSGYIMFNEVSNHCCRKLLCRILLNISELYDL